MQDAYLNLVHMYISQYHNSFYRRYETINFIRKSFINSGLKTHKGKKVKYQHRLIFYYLKNSWLTFKDTSIYKSFSSWRCSYSFNLSQIHNLHYQSSFLSEKQRRRRNVDIRLIDFTQRDQKRNTNRHETSWSTWRKQQNRHT